VPEGFAGRATRKLLRALDRIKPRGERREDRWRAFRAIETSTTIALGELKPVAHTPSALEKSANERATELPHN
jgi:hypothetical protein